MSTRQFALYGPMVLLDRPRETNATRLFIHELGGQFPNLEVLGLYNLDFGIVESSSSPRKFAALSAFTSVRTLTLRECKFPSFAAARYTIASMPSLTDLMVLNITWSIASGPESPLPFLRSPRKSPSLRRLRSLEFWGGITTYEDQILQWLSTTSLAVSLANLTVFSDAFEANATGFWEYVGPSTTQLTIMEVRVQDLRNEGM